MNKTPEILIPALRQYRHNYGSEDYVTAYDEKETNAIIEQLQKENAELRQICIDVYLGCHVSQLNDVTDSVDRAWKLGQRFYRDKQG